MKRIRITSKTEKQIRNTSKTEKLISPEKVCDILDAEKKVNKERMDAISKLNEDVRKIAKRNKAQRKRLGFD